MTKPSYHIGGTIYASSLAEAMRQAGYPPQDPAPGAIARFSTNGCSFDKAGFAIYLPDGTGAIFGDWRTGERFVWQSDAARNLSPAELAERRRQIEAAAQELAAEREAEQAEAAARARRIWERCAPAPPDHAYLAKKRITPDGLRLAEDGRLVAPVYGPDGELASLQFIAPNGEKRFLQGGKMAGGWAALGYPEDGRPIVLCEGWATAASVRMTTGYSVICAFTAGNLLPVARWIRRKWPDARLIIAGDDDRQTPGNPGRAKAQEAAREIGAVAAFPSFGPESTGSDFNDMTLESGLEAVRAVFERALMAEPMPSRKFALVAVAELLRAPRPHDWLIRGYLEADTLALLFGDPAAGKSLLAMGWAASIATGRPWRDCRVKAGPVVYLAGEGHHGLSRRMKAWEVATGQSLAKAPLFVSTGRAGIPSEIDAIAAAADEAVTKHGPPALLVIDTLARHIEGNENDAQDMSAFIGACDELRLRYRCAVLVVHHSGHGDKARARAHSALPGAVDASFALLKREDGTRELACTKAKDFEPPAPRYFSVKAVQLPPPWVDEDGAPLEAPTLEAAAAPVSGAKPERARPMPASARIALEALNWALQEKGVEPPPDVAREAGCGNLAMAWGKVAYIDYWRERVYATCGDEDGDARRKAFQRGREWLLSHGRARVFGSWAWVPLAPLPGHEPPTEEKEFAECPF